MYDDPYVYYHIHLYKQGKLVLPMEKLPFRDCHSCIHLPVCKHIVPLNNIIEKNTLPIDFDLAVCKEHLEAKEYSEAVFMGEPPTDGENFLWSLMSLLDKLIKQDITDIRVAMSTDTQDAILDDCDDSDDIHTVTSINIEGVKVSVIIDDSLGYGEFEIEGT